jgi:hypothetical protein
VVKPPSEYLAVYREFGRSRLSLGRLTGYPKPLQSRGLTSTDVPKLRQMPQGPAHLSVLIRSGFTLSDPFNRFRRLTLSRRQRGFESRCGIPPL